MKNRYKFFIENIEEEMKIFKKFLNIERINNQVYIIFRIGLIIICVYEKKRFNKKCLYKLEKINRKEIRSIFCIFYFVGRDNFNAREMRSKPNNLWNRLMEKHCCDTAYITQWVHPEAQPLTERLSCN